MENNYYTPSIEEFHVGFNYEWKSPLESSGWEPATIEHFDFPMIDHGSGECPFEYALENDSIRVKHLDQEDIESLGFKFHKEGWGDESKIFRNNKFEIYSRSFELITIYNFHEKVLFHGTIKNKSELKQIMGMVGIKP